VWKVGVINKGGARGRSVVLKSSQKECDKLLLKLPLWIDIDRTKLESEGS